MTIILMILFALLGWLAGIAINHAANILPKRQTVLQKPSCTTCSEPFPYPAWSALTSYFMGYRHCPACGEPRPRWARSIIIELVTPLFFIFLAWYYADSYRLFFVTLYTVILILLTVTDLEHRLIFNVVILPSILFAIIAAFFTPGLYWPSALVGGVTAFIITYIAALVSRGGLGEGDVTLATFLGFTVGFPYILLNLLFCVFLGGFVSFLLLATRRVGLKTFIPYGPFLTITGWIMLIWSNEIWKYYYG